MDSITAAIAAVGQAVASIFNWVTGRSQLKNAAPMQQAAAAQTETAAQDKTKAALANGDTKEVEREISE